MPFRGCQWRYVEQLLLISALTERSRHSSKRRQSFDELACAKQSGDREAVAWMWFEYSATLARFGILGAQATLT